MNMHHLYNDIEETTESFLCFKQGDETALSRLYRKFYRLLLRHGFRIVHDEFVVNSSIQDAFLKAWNFRERLTTALHTYRFLRLNVTWKCYNYYRQPDRLHRRIIYTDNIDYYADACYMPDLIGNDHPPFADEEMVQAIYNVMPYLPPDRQTILTLYFKYGFTYKQIAKRFCTSNQAVSIELQKGLEHLKKVIHAKKKLDANIKTPNSSLPYNEILDGELLQLFRLRHEMKLGFDTIAAKMNLSQAYVQQQYVAAHIRIQQMTKRCK
jgi:RNA polymerase sigma factor (sigma-70 family)